MYLFLLYSGPFLWSSGQDIGVLIASDPCSIPGGVIYSIFAINSEKGWQQLKVSRKSMYTVAHIVGIFFFYPNLSTLMHKVEKLVIHSSWEQIAWIRPYLFKTLCPQVNFEGRLLAIIVSWIFSLKVKTSIENAPISKNEMEALITNYVKEYVLTNTWW